MNNITAEDVKAAWLKVFPSSDIIAGSVMGSTYLKCYLQKKHEVANGIRENDPLSYTVWINEDGTVEEQGGAHLTIKAQAQYMAYGSLKMRKLTIKEPDYVKLVKRFTAIKDFIKANEDEWYLDLSDKVK